MKYIFHQHIKVLRCPQHKFGRGGTVPTFYPADSFGAVSDSRFAFGTDLKFTKVDDKNMPRYAKICQNK